MKKELQKFLFNKGIVVVEPLNENKRSAFAVICSLARTFNVSISGEIQYLSSKTESLFEEMIGKDIPLPFYIGFPDSVRELSRSTFFFDQAFSYFSAYLRGENGDPISQMNKSLERSLFEEKTEIKYFKAILEEEAKDVLIRAASDIGSSTRPISLDMIKVLIEIYKEYSFLPEVKSRKNLVDLMIREKFLFEVLRPQLKLNDIVKYLESLSSYDPRYAKNNIKRSSFHLNLSNQDRKKITNLLDDILPRTSEREFKEALEKRKIWCGLMHHIHYKAKCEKGRNFLNAVRNNVAKSSLSEFESLMKNKRFKEASKLLMEEKGTSFLLRNIDYIASRCPKEDLYDLLSKLEVKNPMLLIQLILHYTSFERYGKRVFNFVRNGLTVSHNETESESKKRMTTLDEEKVEILLNAMDKKLDKIYANRFDKIFIEKGMEKYALPLKTASSNSGFRTHCSGTRFPIPEGKKIRLFTYWKLVNDIDLSAIGLNKNFELTEEFSFRTSYNHRKDSPILHSGDVTRGYNGGSEYFDISIPDFRKTYPHVKYLVLTDNVFSGVNFSEAEVKAGYMIREEKDSGEIFEPSTVQTSFRIDASSTHAILFALDIERSELVWINSNLESFSRIAARDYTVLKPIFSLTEVLNMKTFFEKFSDNVSNDINDLKDCSLIITDKEDLVVEEDQILITPYDVEKMFTYLNM